MGKKKKAKKKKKEISVKINASFGGAIRALSAGKPKKKEKKNNK